MCTISWSGWPREKASAEERVARATVLLDAGARLDVRDDLLQNTPLAWACRWGRVEPVDLLLARGADAREVDAKPWTPTRSPRVSASRRRLPIAFLTAARGRGRAPL
jgi:hypothetical protein